MLAGAGIYGVMAFLVAARSREIGIRMALGADAAAIRRLVVRSSARLVAGGVVAGIAIGIAGARAIESQLFGVTAADPITWASVILAIAAIAMFATWRPARAATRLDPSSLLRT